MAEQTKQTDNKVFDMAERTAKYGESIIAFAKQLPRDPIVLPLITQIIRSGTSMGANYCEADNAVSKKEFLHRIAICKKEAKETMYWLRMIACAESDTKQPARILWQEAKELHLIFDAIWRKNKNKLNFDI